MSAVTGGLRGRRSAPRVTFLIQNAHGGGGVARTVANLASSLAETHDVEMVSLFKRRPTAMFPIDERVRITWLVDATKTADPPGLPDRDPGAAAWRRRLHDRPTTLPIDKGDSSDESAYTDFLLRRKLATMRPGVLISTRPSLHRAAARWSPPWVIRVAQDHLNYPVRSKNRNAMAALDDAATRLDAFVTLTHDDERDYGDRWRANPAVGARVVTIPNASPFAPGAPIPLDSRVIISAGRLEQRKGFHRVIRAFDPLRSEFPDWQLHVWGRGGDHAELQRLIDQLGAGDQVRLQGFSSAFDEVLTGGSIYAMGSFHEGLPMVLLEAQAAGLPIVAFDCPRGPADIVHDGVDGRLVVDGDISGYTEALRQVMKDAALRTSMGAAALENAASYRIEPITERWMQLFDELAAARPRLLRPRR